MKARGKPLQYACFACRKSFKRPQMLGGSSHFMLSQQQEAQQREADEANARTYKCPDCGSPTHYMGLNFKAPKRADEKGWSDVQSFILSGGTYYRSR